MSAQQVWRFRDKKTGEWQQHVFFEKPDTSRMVGAEDLELVPMRLLGPNEFDPVTVEICIKAVQSERLTDHTGESDDIAYNLALSDAVEALRSLTGETKE